MRLRAPDIAAAALGGHSITTITGSDLTGGGATALHPPASELLRCLLGDVVTAFNHRASDIRGPRLARS